MSKADFFRHIRHRCSTIHPLCSVGWVAPLNRRNKWPTVAEQPVGFFTLSACSGIRTQ